MYGEYREKFEELKRSIADVCTSAIDLVDAVALVDNIRVVINGNKYNDKVIAECNKLIADIYRKTNIEYDEIMYGWYDFKDKQVRYIYPKAMLVSMCFTGGGVESCMTDVNIATGKIVKLSIKVLGDGVEY